MLVLLFELDGERYAIDARQVVEVLPILQTRPVPNAPAAVHGVFDFRGTPVPVVDVSNLVLSRPTRRRLSSRMVLVRDGEGNDARLVGLLMERATETARRAREDFGPPPVPGERAPYIAGVATDPNGMLRLIDVNRLAAACVPRRPKAPEADAHVAV